MRYPPELVKELQTQGFKRTHTYRGRDAMVIYAKTFQTGAGRRVVDVQLWGDGLYRASHMLNGRGTTHPTEFTDLDSMRQAIEHETFRTDQK